MKRKRKMEKSNGSNIEAVEHREYNMVVHRLKENLPSSKAMTMIDI